MINEKKSEYGKRRDVRERIDREVLKRIKKSRKEKDKLVKIRKPSRYISLSNKLFRGLSNRLAGNRFSKQIKIQIRKANLPMLLNSYISVMFFVTLIAFLLGVVGSVIFSYIGIKFTIELPIINFVSKNFTILGFIKNFLMFGLLMPVFVFVFMFFYPSLEVLSRENKIREELPFAITHMAAIAGSGIEPVRVFGIIGESDEYKVVSSEMRKVVNKINLYGYDLLTALKETAKISPKEIKELFNGMATTISSGGDLKDYLEKRAKDSLTDYKFNKRKQSQVAGIYADIYTGLLIAAPLIFGIILAILSSFGGNVFGVDATTISISGITLIILANIVFLFFLHIAQPGD